MEDLRKERLIFILWNGVVSLFFILMGLFFNEIINTDHWNELFFLILTTVAALCLITSFYYWLFNKVSNYVIVKELLKYFGPLLSVLFLILIERTCVRNNDYLLWGDKISSISEVEKIISNIDELSENMNVAEQISSQNLNANELIEITGKRRRFIDSIKCINEKPEVPGL